MKKPERWTWYEVKVQNVSSKLDAGPKSPLNYVNSIFACHAILKDATGKVEENFSTTILSIHQDRNVAVKTDNLPDIDVADLLRQAWEVGADRVTLIHGDGRMRGRSVEFVNTNTGYFGLRIRQEMRGNTSLKPWVKISTLDCTHNGSTTIKLKRNPNPSRKVTEILLPERTYRR